VTHAAASYDAAVRPAPMILAALAVTVAAGCGGSQKSTLPPSPGKSGAVALSYLARDPEVYADAQIKTVGTVAAVREHNTKLYVLNGGGGKRIVLEPSSAAAGDLGRRVSVSGTFTVTFQLGYEILISRIEPAATL
jgi:hypothetical protein